MGGFRLIGPTHTIHNTAPIRCRCMGYHTRIDQQLQDFLINKVDHVLDLNELPPALQEEMIGAHLPDDMSYSVVVHPPPHPPYKPPVYNPNMW